MDVCARATRAVYNSPPCQPNFDAISPCRKWIEPARTRLNAAQPASRALSAAAVLDVTPMQSFAQCVVFPFAMAVLPTMPAGLGREVI